jgi:hypothetical protein
MMESVHDADMDMWRAIDHGDREIDWRAWFGHPVGADYLTREGKQVADRAIADLTAFFGPGWLNRALQPDLGRHGPAIRGLGRYCPVLALAPAHRADAWVESIRWWASLQLLVEDRVAGAEAVRRDARRDLTIHRLTHVLTQARLAALGASLGASVEVEPGKAGGPGDVLLRMAGEAVFLEIVTFGPDEKLQLNEEHQHRHWLHLITLARSPVYWEGYVPGFLNKADETRWLRATKDAADRCVQTGQPTQIPGPDGRLLIVRPGNLTERTATTSPGLDLEFSHRLEYILDKKGAQTVGAGIAWIWVEDYGGVHDLHPFARMPLDMKITALAGLVGRALAGRPHVAGVAWSSADRRHPLPLDQQAEDQAGLALQRALPIEHLRQTVIVNRGLILPGQTRVLARLCDSEPGWLDWALRHLGVRGGLASLLSQPTQALPSRLWTPTPWR